MTIATTLDTVKMMELRFELGKFGAQLWTRERAKEIRVKLTQQLETLTEDGLVVIDAKGVEVFDYSFANELFGKTLLSLSTEHPGCFLMVENLTPYARENLTKALESLTLAIIERRGGRLTLLGKVHPADEATFSAIVKARTAVTATALRERLGDINLTAVNERLTKLTSLALVRRQRSVSKAGREQYEYSVPL